MTLRFFCRSLLFLPVCRPVGSRRFAVFVVSFPWTYPKACPPSPWATYSWELPRARSFGAQLRKLLFARRFVKTLVSFALSYSSACMLVVTVNWGFTLMGLRLCALLSVSHEWLQLLCLSGSSPPCVAICVLWVFKLCDSCVILGGISFSTGSTSSHTSAVL